MLVGSTPSQDEIDVLLHNDELHMNVDNNDSDNRDVGEILDPVNHDFNESESECEFEEAAPCSKKKNLINILRVSLSAMIRDLQVT